MRSLQIFELKLPQNGNFSPTQYKYTVPLAYILTFFCVSYAYHTRIIRVSYAYMAYTCSIRTTYVSNIRRDYVVNLKAFPLLCYLYVAKTCYRQKKLKLPIATGSDLTMTKQKWDINAYLFAYVFA